MCNLRARDGPIETNSGVLLVVLGGLVFLAGCGDDKKDGDSSATSGTTGTTGATGDGAQPAARRSRSHGLRSQPSRARKTKLVRSEDKTHTARVVTSWCRMFEVELDSKDAPITGGSFVSLARKGFYDDLIFHRIVTASSSRVATRPEPGVGDPVVMGGTTLRLAHRGELSRWRRRATSRQVPPGSQFFVVTSDLRRCHPEYALLGRVKKGLDVVHAIEEVLAGPDERPISPVVIDKIDVRGV